MATNSSPYIFDVTQADFATKVVEASRERPVVVDFWAAWCGPCQVLMPVLAKLAQAYAGKFLLAKVDTDNEQALAGRYGIRGLPTVKLFKNGAVVDEFSGARSEGQVRAWLEPHLPRAADAIVTQAVAAERAGDIAGATRLLQQAIQEDPANDAPKLELARIALAQGKIADAEAVLKQLSLRASNEPTAATLKAQCELLRIVADAPPLATLEQALAQNDNDVQARYRLGARLLLAGRPEEALAQWLELVRRDRQFGDDAGRRALLMAFNLLGGQPDLVKRYRAQLSMALH